MPQGAEQLDQSQVEIEDQTQWGVWLADVRPRREARLIETYENDYAAVLHTVAHRKSARSHWSARPG